MQLLNPINFPDWDRLLLSTPGATFFHSSSWARVLSESYGYTPLYFAVPENDRFKTLVPMMEVASFLTGKRGVSLPFTDYCEPLIEVRSEESGVRSQETLKPETCNLVPSAPPLAPNALRLARWFNEVIGIGEKRGWKYIEIRGGEKYFGSQESGVRRQENLELGTWNLMPCPSGLASSPSSSDINPSSRAPWTVHRAPSVTYFGHKLDLTCGEEKIFSGFRDSTKRNIKKAATEGVSVEMFHSPEAVKEFYRLNQLTRKDHGLPPQPSKFFQIIGEEIIGKELGFVALASHKGEVIAGAVYFQFGGEGIYKYGASDRKYQNLRANNLVMWEAIKWHCRKGYKSLCFGRTEQENDGLRQFKKGWGSEEYLIPYFKYDLRTESFVAEKKVVSEAEHKIFGHMPIPVLNFVGSLLYKHMG